MPELEKDIEIPVCKWAIKNGFLAIKVKFVEDGYPDRLFISPFGHTIFIEFKRRGQVPTKLQEYRLAELQKRGIPATWHDTIVGAITTLKAALEPASVPDAGNKTDAESGIGGAIPGPGTGKDFHGVSIIQSPERERVCQEDVNRGPTQASLQSVAGRDKEVGGLRRADVHNPPWIEQGFESDD